MAEHNITGRLGEDMACDILASRGYAIRDRNWRAGRLELDIVASKGDTLVFAEVKTRSEDYGEDPIEAIDRRKIMRIIRAAEAYVSAHGLERFDIRFDVFGVTGNSPCDFKVEHIEDAFDVPLKTYR